MTHSPPIQSIEMSSREQQRLEYIPKRMCTYVHTYLHTFK